MGLQEEKEEKLKILRKKTLPALDKKFGENSYYIGAKKIPKVPLICSTGSLSLDSAVGIGGFPAGRIIEIGGQESSSKTTLTLINIAEIQRKGMLCAYIDAEQSFDPAWAQKMNVNVDELLISQPDTAEEAFETLYEIMDSGVVSYIVVDSTNALIPRCVFESDTAGDSTMGKGARIISGELPKVQRKCTEHSCTVVFISQIRASMDKYHPEVVGIGNAMKFWATLRLKTTRAEIEKDDGEEGQSKVDVKINVFKNKIAVPFKKAQFTLLTGENGKYGIDTDKEVLEFAIKYDIVKKAGSWFSYGEERLGQGVDNVKKFFTENPNIFTTVKEQIYARFESDRQKGESAGSFNSALTEAVEENEKPTRKRKIKDEIVTEEISVSEVKESDAEIVEEK
jgi:recombination protein RecA